MTSRKIIGLMRKVSSIGSRQMVDRFIRRKHSKMYRQPISMESSQELRGRCSLDHIECCLEDLVFPGRLEISKQSMRSSEASQEL
jgi:hypothetical protein